ncbi:MAG: filamentous hemagglutinin N-terminal domain-containing protein, partial [Ruminococcus sp.]|nr:filamentous hemagglutinin N-terminal domain-containing protein [Ruminococcus sp.]
MKRKTRNEKLAKQISLALMAGMVTCTPVAFGMPVLDSKPDTVTINPGTAVMGISSSETNNVINWVDFSIGQGEAVNFDANNYANIVTGSATSFIDGHMNGGGDIYLINPNGVVFGKTAEVNVGSLYVSTQGLGEDKTTYDAITSAVTSPITTTVASDVVNLGTIQAKKVEVVGNNIRFLNTDNIVTTEGVNIKASGYVHLGHAVGSEAADAENNTQYTGVNFATPNDYNITNLDETETKTADNYMLVRNLNELKNIKNNKSANYMLADHINQEAASKTEFTPIDGFSGKFDGMFYTINKLEIKRKNGDEAGHTGLFASTSGVNADVRIENVGIVDSAVYGYDNKACGAIIGNSTSAKTTLKNVYATGTSVSERSGSGEQLSKYGGLVGHNSAGDLIIDTAFYDGGTSSGCVGSGIIGYTQSSHSVQISNVYSQGTIKQNGIAGKGTPAASISNAYTSADKIMGNASIPGTFTKLTDSSDSSYKQKKVYSDVVWDINDTGGVTIDGDGNVKKSTWRIYAGQSLPMLTAFFKGTVQANYNFTMGDPATTGFAGYNLADAPHTDQAYETNRYWTDDQGNVVTTYNGQIAAATPTTGTSFASLIGTGDNDIKYNAKTSANADRGTDASSSYALYSSGQLGYDVAGSNFTVEKRKVVGTSSTSEVTIPASKVYDGTSTIALTGDVSTAFNDPTGITGIVAGDDVTLSGTVTGTMYADDTYTVEVVDVNTEGKYCALLNFKNLALSGANKDNYELTVTSGSDITTNDASITPKALYVSLNQATGLNKTYDGLTDINNTAYGWDNVVTDDSGKITTARVHKGETEARADEVSIVKGNDTDNPVTYSSKNAGEQDVVYTGLALTGKEKNNYVLKYKEGGTEVGPVANGTITGKGT